MENNRKIRNGLIASIIAIIFSLISMVGATAAWFTDYVTNNNIIVSGNVDVELWHTACYNAMPYGFGFSEGNCEEVKKDTKLFQNVNGEAVLWEPGVEVGETFRIKNVGSLALKYEFRVKTVKANKTEQGKDLTEILNLEAIEFDYTENGTPFSPAEGLRYHDVFGEGYTISGELLAGEMVDYWIGIDWEPSQFDNLYNVKGGLSILFGIELVATQFAYEADGFNGTGFDDNAQFPQTPDLWNGESDISWYTQNPDAQEFELNSAEALAGLSQLINGTATMPYSAGINLPVNFDGKTVKLVSDVDLTGELFAPIGLYTYEQVIPFTGTFDGNGYTIYNMTQNGWDQGIEHGLGLFAAVENAVIKNLNIDGADLHMEFCEMGAVAALANGECTFENISVKNSQISNYQQSTGGIVGEVIDANVKLINCDIDETNIVEAIWCSADCPVGGLIGYTKNSTVYIQDCDVACVLDVYNDVCYAYQWYNYRRAGMIIGHTRETATIDGRAYATASFLTANNCTVIYGEWANYTYCQFASVGGKFVREQGAENTDAYWNGKTWTTAKDANGNVVVDSNHVHADGEQHSILLEFDQLFGGDTGVKGTATFEGVLVVYNNK